LRSNFGIVYEFPHEICVGNMGTHLGEELGIGETTILDSIVMIICLSFISKSLLDFDLIPIYFTFMYIPLCKNYSCISM